MFTSVRIIGHGRVGSALAARLRERGLDLGAAAPEAIVLCVPDRAISSVAAAIGPGPWLVHVSGATPLSALAPHTNRFSMHPLQTFSRSGAAEQLDGAWAAITGETDTARARGTWLAETLGLQPFDLQEQSRVLYHAGAVMASNYLVTLYRAATKLFDHAGAPPEALLPLMRRTIDNGFDLTGPIARGDWSIVDSHLAAIRAEVPELAQVYEALARVTAP